MKRWLFAIAALVLPPAAAHAAAEFKIATADPRGTYFAIGNDLAKMVAPTADITLEVVPTDGSAHNIRLLREAPGVKFAIVQADVFQTFVDRAAGANREAAQDHRAAARHPAALQHRDPLHRPRGFAAELHPRPEGRPGQRRPGGQRRGVHHPHALPDDVRRLDAGGERDLPAQRPGADQADHGQVDRRSGGGGGPAGADHRQHEARGAAVHQAAEIRSLASFEQAAAHHLCARRRCGRRATRTC